MRRSKSFGGLMGEIRPLIISDLALVLVRMKTKETTLNRLKSLTLAFTLVLTPLAQIARAQAQTSPDQSAKIKTEVAKRIANKKNHVNIELRNGDKLKGRLQQADDNRFTILQDKTGKTIEISYDDVLKVKGQGLGTGAKIGIAVGVAAAVVAVVVVVALKNFDPFEGGIRIPYFFFPSINHHALKALSNANPPQTIATRRKPATND